MLLKKKLQDVVNKYGYYKFSCTTRQKKYKLNTIRDNEFDVGYSGVVNAHR